MCYLTFNKPPATTLTVCFKATTFLFIWWLTKGHTYCLALSLKFVSQGKQLRYWSIRLLSQTVMNLLLRYQMMTLRYTKLWRKLKLIIWWRKCAVRAIVTWIIAKLCHVLIKLNLINPSTLLGILCYAASRCFSRLLLPAVTQGEEKSA